MSPVGRRNPDIIVPSRKTAKSTADFVTTTTVAGTREFPKLLRTIGYQGQRGGGTRDRGGPVRRWQERSAAAQHTSCVLAVILRQLNELVQDTVPLCAFAAPIPLHSHRN